MDYKWRTLEFQVIRETNANTSLSILQGYLDQMSNARLLIGVHLDAISFGSCVRNIDCVIR